MCIYYVRQLIDWVCWSGLVYSVKTNYTREAVVGHVFTVV